MFDLECPKCKSNRVRVRYPDIECLSCLWSEPLHDYPISWDWHRGLCYEFGLPDPGPSKISGDTLQMAEVQNRLAALEEAVLKPSPAELRQYKLKRIYDEIQNIKMGLRHTQRIVAQSTRVRRPKRAKLTEI